MQSQIVHIPLSSDVEISQIADLLDDSRIY